MLKKDSVRQRHPKTYCRPNKDMKNGRQRADMKGIKVLLSVGRFNIVWGIYIQRIFGGNEPRSTLWECNEILIRAGILCIMFSILTVCCWYKFADILESDLSYYVVLTRDSGHVKVFP